MIRVFSPNDKIFTSNGDLVIQTFKAKVHKVDNGDYYLDFEAGILLDPLNSCTLVQ